MPEPIRAILIGAGQRGAKDYAPYALRYPEQLKFVGVAEPDPARRAWFSAEHNIPLENVFESWEPLLASDLAAQAALVCTQDQQHTAPAVAALHAGYHVLLEKPMATTPEECRLLVQTARTQQRQLHICHVLRYTTHFQKMRAVLGSGVLGQIVNVAHRENVSWWHMAHSYVRGNWADQNRSSPMILAKCCHDFDILLWLLEKKCIQLSSVGSLMHYRPENAPPGAPAYCLDGCPAADTCPYYAPFIYAGLRPFWRSYAATANGLPRLAAKAYLGAPVPFKAASKVWPYLRQASQYQAWPLSVLVQDPTPENVMEALRKGPYGRCVYHCDNNVVDHQVVTMQLEQGASVTLTMHGHSHIEGRSTRIEGSLGTLMAHFGNGGSWIDVYEHRSGLRTQYNTTASSSRGHGGGDEALMAAFIKSLNSDGAAALTTAEQALESHLMAFAAERARVEGVIVGRQGFGADG